MRLLIDSDMLAEFVGEKADTVLAWNKINALEITGTAELWVCAASINAVRQTLSAAVGEHDVRQALRSAIAFLSVCSIDAADIRFALDTESISYLDALVESCARKIQADFIITGRGPLPIPRAIRRVSPEELFRVLEAERGLVFDLVDF